MNKSPLLKFIFDRKHIATGEKEAPVELRVTGDYKQIYFDLGVKLTKRQWNQNAAQVVNRPDAAELNLTLEKFLRNVRQVINDMLDEGNVDMKAIRDRLKRKQTGVVSFIDFCDRRSKERKFNLSKDSKERYDRFMKKFVEWGGIEFFPDVTESSIIAFDEWLDMKKMKPYSKWNNYHRFLNSFIIDAVREGLMTRNPYLHVRIKKEKSTGGIGKYLSPEEFQKVKVVELPTESLRKVRDVFVFQTYTCMAYKDLAAFNVSKIVEVKGMKVYVGQRVKTGQTFTVPLLQEALDILEKYHNKLPIITNVKYNEYLKLVAQAAGIEKPISSHWARHTGATLLLNEGGFDMKIVAKILGHSTTRITEQVYAKLLDETVVDEMKKFEEKQKQKKENDDENN